jgi:hypothetical protein
MKMSKPERQAVYAAYTKAGIFFLVEPSPSGRARCRGCGGFIGEGELRLRHFVCSSNRCYTEKKSGNPDTCGRWHVPCLLKQQTEHAEKFVYTNPAWQPVVSLAQIAGTEGLSAAQRTDLATLLAGASPSTDKRAAATTAPEEKPAKRRQR